MALTQPDIDRIIRPSPEPRVTLKLAAVVVGIVGLLALFWFNAVSALPFLYTAGWHKDVSEHVKVGQSKMAELAVVQTNQANLEKTLTKIERTQERQADELSAIRRMVEEYLRRDADRHKER